MTLKMTLIFHVFYYIKTNRPPRQYPRQYPQAPHQYATPPALVPYIIQGDSIRRESL